MRIDDTKLLLIELLQNRAPKMFFSIEWMDVTVIGPIGWGFMTWESICIGRIFFIWTETNPTKYEAPLGTKARNLGAPLAEAFYGWLIRQVLISCCFFIFIRQQPCFLRFGGVMWRGKGLNQYSWLMTTKSSWNLSFACIIKLMGRRELAPFPWQFYPYNKPSRLGNIGSIRKFGWFGGHSCVDEAFKDLNCADPFCEPFTQSVCSRTKEITPEFQVNFQVKAGIPSHGGSFPADVKITKTVEVAFQFVWRVAEWEAKWPFRRSCHEPPSRSSKPWSRSYRPEGHGGESGPGTRRSLFSFRALDSKVLSGSRSFLVTLYPVADTSRLRYNPRTRTQVWRW